MTTTTTAPITVPDSLATPLSSTTVAELTSWCDDTPFMAQRRTDAHVAFEKLPWPTNRDENWRFTKLRGIKLDEVPTHSTRSDLDKVTQRIESTVTGTDESAGRIVHVNGSTVEADAETMDLPDGVIFTSIDDAARNHAELFEKWFGVAVPLGDSVNDKFVAMQQAGMANGTFLYVPRGVKVDKPLRTDIVMTPGQSVNWRALVVLEEQAEATFVEEYTSTDSDAEGFSNVVVEVIAGAASNLHYVTAQDYAEPVAHFATHRVVAQRDAQVDWSAIGLGASRGKVRMEVTMDGPGSNVRLSGAYFLDGRQELDYDTYQLHNARNATSDLAFRGVLAQNARSVWRGMIAVAEGAQGTDSYQDNRNLLLDSSAHADSIPGLQIEANEVRCTHGATISKVDPEQLFYLQARGIPREQAIREIVRGFFMPVLERIGAPAVRDQLKAALWNRIEQAREGR